MRCCVPGCKNDSRYSTKSQGITFHVFPVEQSLRTAWLQALGKETWEPKERSAVCSDHFVADDLYETKKGLRRKVRRGAVPILLQESEDSDYGDQAALKACRLCLAVDANLLPIKKHKLDYAYHCLTGIMPTPGDRLPQRICVECASRLASCARLRYRGLRAHSLMMELLKKYKQLTTQNLKWTRNDYVQLTSPLSSKHYPADHCDLLIDELLTDTAINDKTLDVIATTGKTDQSNIAIFLNGVDNEKDDASEEADTAVPKVEPLSDVVKMSEITDENDIFFNELDVKQDIGGDDENDKSNDDFEATQSTTDEELPKGFMDEEAYNSHMLRHSNLTTQNFKSTRNDYAQIQSPFSSKHYPADHCDLLKDELLTDTAINDKTLDVIVTIGKTAQSNIAIFLDDVDNEKDDASEEADTAVPKVEPLSDVVKMSEITDENDIFFNQLDVKQDIGGDDENDKSNDDFEATQSTTDEELPRGVLRSILQERCKKGKGKVAKRVRKSKKKIDDKQAQPKEDRRRKPFLSEDLKEALFTVKDLTFEEQIAEIDNRKESANYKNSVYKCEECYKGFLDEEAYNSHMLRHSNESGEYRCNICKTHFKHSNALRKHTTAHHMQRFSCKQCPFTSTNRDSARLHERWHKGTKYACPHCPEEFVKVTTYMSHVRIKHPSDFVCQLCGYSFVSEKGIQLHKRLKHRQDVQIPDDGPYCEPCGVRFVDVDALRRHISVSARHSTADKAPNSSTKGKTRGVGGQRNRREGVRPVQNSRTRIVDGPIPCEQCGLQLADPRVYHSHFRRMHPDKNRTNFPSMKSMCMCEVCGKMFQSYALLKDHRWVHTGERPFSCELCGKAFRMKQQLVAHRRVHSAERTAYACTLCGKTFSTCGNRHRHMFIHTGLKPFKCEMCGKGFQHASDKRAHVSYVHLKKPWPKRSRGKRRPDTQVPMQSASLSS